MFKKKYLNVISVETAKDMETIMVKEDPGTSYGYEYGNRKRLNNLPSETNPVRLTIQKPRTLFSAIRKAYEYSKMNIFNMIIKVNYD